MINAARVTATGSRAGRSVSSAQEFDDDVERLRAIADHINGNLLGDEPETANATNCKDDCHYVEE